jgi:hypothetical protein
VPNPIVRRGVRRRRRAALLMAVPLVVGLAGCGDDDAADEASTTPTTSFYDRIFGGPEDGAAQQREYEELIRVCMVDLGFEYIPYEPQVYDASTAALEQAEFREQYGYGISTYIDQEMPTDDAYEDPNQPYIDSLSPANQEAYYAALWGDSYDEPAVEDGEPPEPSGCANEAGTEVYGDTSTQDDSLYRDLDEMEQAIQADERLVAATEDWSECMADAGFEYESQNAIYEDLNAQVSEIMGWDTGGGFAISRPVGVGKAAPAGKAAADDQVPWVSTDTAVSGEEQQEYDHEALAELQAYELSVAEADDECREEHVVDVEAEVREDHQADFLDQHPDL